MRGVANPETPRPRWALVGGGRVGSALHARLAGGPFEVLGPFGRDAPVPDADVVLLCVPDAEIAPAARAVRPGALVGHCSGATGLDVLAPHDAFGVHPLMTITGPETVFAGAACAIAATSERGRAAARALADALGMTSFEIAD